MLISVMFEFKIFMLVLTGYSTYGRSSMIDKQSSLVDTLLDQYDNKIRPVYVYNNTVLVKFKLYFNQILDVVSKTFQNQKKS